MYCQYLSHRHCDSRILAGIGPDYVKATQPKGSVCIRTCHRLEFCSNTPFELPPPPRSLASAWRRVSGVEQVLIRLATVAAGADSKILGEQFIAQQCSRPFLKTHVPDLPFDLIAGAFDVASRLKKSMRFETTFSYDDAAFSLLKADPQRPRPSALVVFGAGLLGQAIVRHPLARDYARVIVITRKPRECLHSLRLAGEPAAIEARTLAEADLPRSYDCVIATDNRSRSFAEEVKRLLGTRRPGHAVDLCAIPVLANPPSELTGVYHMESRLMHSLIDAANSRLDALVPPLRESIAVAINKLCTPRAVRS